MIFIVWLHVTVHHLIPTAFTLFLDMLERVSTEAPNNYGKNVKQS